MKKLIVYLLLFIAASCQKNVPQGQADLEAVDVSIDLTKVKNDRVSVSIHPRHFDKDTVQYYLPKIVQGTYEISDYGKFIDDLRATDAEGNELLTQKTDENTWMITNARNLNKITYWVNDTYDVEKSQTTTPGYPSGTNIDTNIFVLNLQGFIGYFDNSTEVPYHIAITAPSNLEHVTPLQKVSTITEDQSVVDTYMASRYFNITDKPIIYGHLDIEEFDVKNVKITLCVYSPTRQHKAQALKDKIAETITAQKSYLGDLSSTKTYDIYIYLTEEKTDAERKYGALEHTTSTLVVFPEEIASEELINQSADIIAHEFFHTVTSLRIHSEKIHFFRYNIPTFSQHIWFYEGVTEYFSEHFRVQQQLISPEDYLDKIERQIYVSGHFDDSLSFTELSAHIIDQPYADNFINVYFKGPLIAMCVDILIREESEGERNIISVMKELSVKYGEDKYFNDDNFINELSTMTFPIVGEFLNTHVVNGNPIDYGYFLNKVGLTVVKQDSQKVELVKVKNPSDEQLLLKDNWLNK